MIPINRLLKPESQGDSQQEPMFHASHSLQTKAYQGDFGRPTISDIGTDNYSSGPFVSGGVCAGGVGVCYEVGSAGGSTTTTTTNTVSTRVDTGGSDQDTLNTLQWDRSSLGPITETWSFYQIILHLLQSNGLEDLPTHTCCDPTENDGATLIRSILQYTANLDRQEQAGASTRAGVDKSTNPVAAEHICTELQSTCPILFPRLCRLLDFRLAETGETLLHAAAR